MNKVIIQEFRYYVQSRPRIAGKGPSKLEPEPREGSEKSATKLNRRTKETSVCITERAAQVRCGQRVVSCEEAAPRALPTCAER